MKTVKTILKYANLIAGITTLTASVIFCFFTWQPYYGWAAIYFLQTIYFFITYYEYKQC